MLSCAPYLGGSLFLVSMSTLVDIRTQRDKSSTFKIFYMQILAFIKNFFAPSPLTIVQFITQKRVINMKIRKT